MEKSLNRESNEKDKREIPEENLYNFLELLYQLDPCTKYRSLSENDFGTLQIQVAAF
jgi:hypothetical protein